MCSLNHRSFTAYLVFFPPPRLKQLREEPYTQAEAERAAGMGSYIPPKTVEVKTQPLEEDMDWEPPTLIHGLIYSITQAFTKWIALVLLNIFTIPDASLHAFIFFVSNDVCSSASCDIHIIMFRYSGSGGILDTIPVYMQNSRTVWNDNKMNMPHFIVHKQQK